MNDDNQTLFRRELACKLTTEESARYGQMLSSKVRERDLVDETRKSVAAEYGAKIKTITAEISRIAVALDKGEELRPIDCRLEFAAGTMRTVRIDTGEVVSVRPATLAERQTTLPAVGDTTTAPSDTDFPDLDEGPAGEELAPSDPSSVVHVDFDPGADIDDLDLGDTQDDELVATPSPRKGKAPKAPKAPRRAKAKK